MAAFEENKKKEQPYVKMGKESVTFHGRLSALEKFFIHTTSREINPLEQQLNSKSYIKKNMSQGHSERPDASLLLFHVIVCFSYKLENMLCWCLLRMRSSSPPDGVNRSHEY